MHAHTCVPSSRVHACGTDGVWGAGQKELATAVTWATGIPLGPFLEPHLSQASSPWGNLRGALLTPLWPEASEQHRQDPEWSRPGHLPAGSFYSPL